MYASCHCNTEPLLTTGRCTYATDYMACRALCSVGYNELIRLLIVIGEFDQLVVCLTNDIVVGVSHYLFLTYLI